MQRFFSPSLSLSSDFSIFFIARRNYVVFFAGVLLCCCSVRFFFHTHSLTFLAVSLVPSVYMGVLLPSILMSRWLLLSVLLSLIPLLLPVRVCVFFLFSAVLFALFSLFFPRIFAWIFFVVAFFGMTQKKRETLTHTDTEIHVFVARFFAWSPISDVYCDLIRFWFYTGATQTYTYRHNIYQSYSHGRQSTLYSTEKKAREENDTHKTDADLHKFFCLFLSFDFWLFLSVDDNIQNERRAHTNETRKPHKPHTQTLKTTTTKKFISKMRRKKVVKPKTRRRREKGSNSRVCVCVHFFFSPVVVLFDISSSFSIFVPFLHFLVVCVCVGFDFGIFFSSSALYILSFSQVCAIATKI